MRLKINQKEDFLSSYMFTLLITYLKTTQRNLTTERDHIEWTIPPVLVRKYLYNSKKVVRVISEN